MVTVVAGEGYGRERFNTRRANCAVRRWWRVAVRQDKRGEQSAGEAVCNHCEGEGQGDQGAARGERQALEQERSPQPPERRPNGHTDPPGEGWSILGFINRFRAGPTHDVIGRLRDHEVAANTAADEIARRNDASTVNDIYDAVFGPDARGRG